MTYVTFGSQIGNPFVVRNLTPGRIEPLAVRQWYHLYNSNDRVFTAEIKLPGVENFLQIPATFTDNSFANHSALEYLGHANTVSGVWQPTSLIESNQASTRSIGRSMVAVRAQVGSTRAKRRRAILIGMNEYPDPAKEPRQNKLPKLGLNEMGVTGIPGCRQQCLQSLG